MAPQPLPPARRRAGLLASRRGAAIIEFAMLAPVLITVLCGLGDFAITIYANMLTNNATQGLADLATQASRLQVTDMNNIYNAAIGMMAPLSASHLVLRITNVYSDGNGHAYVYWSCGEGVFPPYIAKSQVTTSPTGSPISNYIWLNNFTANGYTYNGTNTSVVMVESQNSIVPPTQFVLKGTQTISGVSYTLPRLSTFIGFPWDGVPTDYPTTPTQTTTTATATFTANGATVTCNYAK